MTTLLLTRPPPDADPAFIKACCANLYASPWATWLLGDAFHPGGLGLTTRLAEAAGVEGDSHVVDVAAGRGTSAIHLATRYGCQVTAVDYGADNVDHGRRAAAEAGVADRVRFVQGDAEALPLATGTADIILCECAFCTFPDKAAAAAELKRVLRPSGRVALSDLTRSRPLPPDLNGLLAWISCLADALPLADYERHLTGAGLTITAVTPHNHALKALVHDIQGRLLGAELMMKLRGVDLAGFELAEARRVARAARAAVADGTLGYALVVGENS